MSKKKIVVLIIILIVVLIGGFFALEYVSAPENKTENNLNDADGAEVDQNNNSDNFQPEVEIGGVEVNGNNNSGLIICSDKCGDGVCQTKDLECNDKSNLNCTCPETKEDCPQDCK